MLLINLFVLKDVPKMTISFGATIQHDLIEEGSNVSLECHITANPNVSEIGWMFEGQSLSIGDSNNVGGESVAKNSLSVDGSFQTRENTLIIYNVHRRHSGRYRCIAANSQGEGLSEEIQLKIQCKLFNATETINEL